MEQLKISKDNFKITFLNKFISQFCETSVKRRSWNNTAARITEILNAISKKHFNSKINFSTDEVIESFYQSGFTIMDNQKEEFNWDNFHKESVLATNNEFINVKSNIIKDLKLTTLTNYPSNWKIETLSRIDNLKSELISFWNSNKHIVM